MVFVGEVRKCEMMMMMMIIIFDLADIMLWFMNG